MKDASDTIAAALGPADVKLLKQLARWAAPQPLALVGGAVRDALLGQARSSPDLDVVLAGDVAALAARYSAESGEKHVFYPQYGNATLTLPDGRQLDLISARRERYPVHGGPPEVTAADLAADLARRDFAINAMCWLPATGELLAASHAFEDLRSRVLRPLHRESFSEDASRLVRGARLAARLNLTPHETLLEQVPDALRMANRTPRLWSEVDLLLHERRGTVAARLLVDWGAGELLGAGAGHWPTLQGQNLVRPVALLAALLHCIADDHLLHGLPLAARARDLLKRAAGERIFPEGSAEMALRASLCPERCTYTPLQGRDLLAAGFAAGPDIGAALAHLAHLRRAGLVVSQEDEWQAVQSLSSQVPPSTKGS